MPPVLVGPDLSYEEELVEERMNYDFFCLRIQSSLMVKNDLTTQLVTQYEILIVILHASLRLDANGSWKF